MNDDVDTKDNISRLDAAQVHPDTPVKPPSPQWEGLRRVPDKLPAVALLILVVETTCKRLWLTPARDSNPYDPASDLPGALGRGQAVATALGNFFKFWAYASTVIGAVVADQYLGKFKAILAACAVYVVGLVILVATSTPASIQNGAGFGGLIAAMVTIGLGTGGIKANVTPMCAEQYRNSHAVVRTLKSGEEVLVDPELTVQRLFMWFYWVVNIGALSPLITVNVEAHHSFWLAYLIPLIAILISAAVFLSGQKKYVKVPPEGSAIVDALRVARIAMREKGFENATPSALREAGRDGNYAVVGEAWYTDGYVVDVMRGLKSCKNLDPIALCIFIPFLDMVVYPLLRKYRIDFDPVTRIFTGFLFASVSMVYASVLQHRIYNSPPKSIHVWIQAPAYILVALSEAFIIVTGLELAFTQAPKNLRSVVSALFWLTIGVAAAICIALAPVSQDPYLVWMYGSLGIVGFVAGCSFYACFYPGRSKRSPEQDVIIEGRTP
ncbi:POT family protein [Colletotrichum higginsianum]|nr:POT family protein [Colletotrichum higginsianum]